MTFLINIKLPPIPKTPAGNPYDPAPLFAAAFDAPLAPPKDIESPPPPKPESPPPKTCHDGEGSAAGEMERSNLPHPVVSSTSGN